ncbi:carbohydrate ABC transporter permease [Chitinimonas sp. BJB300]|uniref:carbohydrate ABC transporter permease n=1 Tax=Chitinimonas sp. BJB300 TaxID=1559339 RepID=UPI000C107ED3|nr:carbohydrate ABC transporter permease [Chitinimonas sp. BJB300]PHV12252.1 sugar ABC transporter permease [Chitinimonas sp. BJB300]TSJ84764.1 carbohydrate ABC transporter permease [Chitinimonas sp. BJB300]
MTDITTLPASAATPATRSKTFNYQRWLNRSLHYLVLSALAVITVYPFWWTLVTAVSTAGKVYAFPPALLPTEPGLQNFLEVFQTINVWAFYKNSILISGATVVGTLIICSLAAYPIARMRFAGRNFVFGAIVATMILPSEVNFLINFITVSKLGLTDTISGVVLPNLAGAVGIFLMKQAFEAVPQDLIDAAKVDGANEWEVFWKIMLPLAKPALGALAILTLVSAWNQYIWPSIVMTSVENFPLSVGVSYLKGAFSFKTRLVAAGAVLTVLPILIMFLFTQRYFLRGFEGAVK